MLVALDAASNARVEARRTTPTASYFCPGCGAAVVLKRGRVVASHFAHQAQDRCRYAQGETAEHLAAKRAFAAALAGRGLAHELEAEVLSGEGDRRADVLVRHPGSGRPVAIEIQHSPLGVEAIAARTAAYAAAGVAVIWVPTLQPARLPLQRVAGTAFLALEAFEAPAWQCWAHAYHGALWYLDASDGALWRGRLADRWVRDPGPSHRDPNAPPGWRRASRSHHLLLDGPHALEDARIRLGERTFRPHETYRLPGGPAAGLVLPTPAPRLRTHWQATEDGLLAPRLELSAPTGPRAVHLAPLAPAARARQAAGRQGACDER